VKSLAETLELPLTEVAELLADDREDYVPPAALAPAVDVKEGSLFTKNTVDAYIAAVIELWRLQVAHGNSNVENPRGAAVRGFLEQRGRQQGKLDRANFKDRGGDGPEWNDFALLVQAEATGASEPQSLLLQRALPELSSVLQSSREAILQNSQRLAARLEDKVQGLQGSLDALLRGQIPVTFTGYFGAGPAVPATGLIGQGTAPVAAPIATLAAISPALAPPGAATAIGQSLPVFTALARAFTVKEVWREWKEGLAGRPAIQELEERWGSSWRPGNAVRVQFCRRKVIWDELLARIARGKSEEEAVAELEQLRAGRSLNRLVDELKQRHQQQRRPAGPAPGRARGQGRTGRWGRWGRRGGVPSRRTAS
jgi:hypothetical protein